MSVTNPVCPQCGAPQDEEFTANALKAGQAGREAVAFWFESARLTLPESTEKFHEIMLRLQAAQGVQVTFDQALAACGDLTRNQAEKWWRELREEGIPTPALDSWLEAHGGLPSFGDGLEDLTGGTA